MQKGISKPLQEMMVSSGDEDSGYGSSSSNFGGPGSHFSSRSEMHGGSFSSGGYGGGFNRGSQKYDKDDFGDEDDSDEDDDDDFK